MGVLATGAPRRLAARGACDALRRSPVEVFLVRRVMAVVFFDRWRVFPATACVVDLTSLVDGSSEHPEKICSPGGAARVRFFYSFSKLYSTISEKIKGLRHCKKVHFHGILKILFS
jgi:hypothetical protein